MLTFVLPRLLMLLFPRLLLLPPMLLLFRFPPELMLFWLRSLVLTPLRAPWVPDPPAPGRLWLPPLIDGCVPADGRDAPWPYPSEARFEALGEDRPFAGARLPAAPPRPPPPPPRMRCANASFEMKTSWPRTSTAATARANHTF